MVTKQSEKPDSTKPKKDVEKRKEALSGRKKTKTDEETRKQQKEKRKEEKKKRKEEKKKRKQEKKKRKKPRRRIFPIWLRIIVVLLLAAGALILGLMIGFAVLGDGEALDVLKMETWEHIVDIVTKEKN